MSYEVEMKFPLGAAADGNSVEPRLLALGAKACQPIEQRDAYFAHPSRDFAQTDEAFRLRSVGEQNFLTYKGPKLDVQTKTRREIEISVAAGADGASQMIQMLTLLGFRRVREVIKTRTPFHLRWQDRDWEVAIDDVHGLGRFVEIETLADDATRDAARDDVLSLSRELALGQSERRSYLQMLLEPVNG